MAVSSPSNPPCRRWQVACVHNKSWLSCCRGPPHPWSCSRHEVLMSFRWYKVGPRPAPAQQKRIHLGARLLVCARQVAVANTAANVGAKRRVDGHILRALRVVGHTFVAETPQPASRPELWRHIEAVVILKVHDRLVAAERILEALQRGQLHGPCTSTLTAQMGCGRLSAGASGVALDELMAPFEGGRGVLLLFQSRASSGSATMGVTLRSARRWRSPSPLWVSVKGCSVVAPSALYSMLIEGAPFDAHAWINVTLSWSRHFWYSRLYSSGWHSTAIALKSMASASNVCSPPRAPISMIAPDPPLPQPGRMLRASAIAAENGGSCEPQ